MSHRDLTLDLPRYKEATTLFHFFINTVQDYRDNLAYIYNENGKEHQITYRQLFDEVFRLAIAFDERGIGKGDKILLVSDNRYQWILTDLALICCGAAVVPRGADTPCEELCHIYRHSEARHIIFETKELFEEHGDALLAISNAQTIFLIEDDFAGETAATPYSRLLAEKIDYGQALTGFVARGEALGPDDLLTLIYTSGTVGLPKGVQLSHGNLMHNINCVPVLISLTEKDSWLSILPSWHIFERTAEYVALSRGTTLVYSSVKTFLEDLEKYQPTLVATVPRVWEMMYTRVCAGVRKKGRFAERLFSFLLLVSTSYQKSYRRAHGRLPAFASDRGGKEAFLRITARLYSWLLYPFHSLAQRKFSMLRDRFGGRLRLAVSAGGTLADYLEEWIDAIGIRIVNAYGMTETSPAIAGRGLNSRIFGTLGPVVPETTLRIVSADGKELPMGVEGRIEVKGPQVTKGYYNNDRENQESFTEDGFLKTGDLGKLTVSGELVLTGRAKEIIVLSNGENVDPTRIENAITRFPFIQDAVLVGQDKRGLGALLVPDMEELRQYLSEKIQGFVAKEQFQKDDTVLATIKKELNRFLHTRRGFRPHEKLQNIVFLESPLKLGEEVTNTLKKKRHIIEEKYRPLINDLLR